MEVNFSASDNCAKGALVAMIRANKPVIRNPYCTLGGNNRQAIFVIPFRRDRNEELPGEPAILWDCESFWD